MLGHSSHAERCQVAGALLSVKGTACDKRKSRWSRPSWGFQSRHGETTVTTQVGVRVLRAEEENGAGRGGRAEATLYTDWSGAHLTR